MLRGLKQILCTPGPMDHTETETEMCWSISCGGMGQQWTATGAGALSAADLGMTQALLEEVAINPTKELPELTQDWGNRLLEGTNKTLCTRTQEKGAVTPQETDPVLPVNAQESLARGMGQQWPAPGLGVLNITVCAQDLLKEVTIIFITPTIAWSQVKQQRGKTVLPINRILD